ncbi:unnamed protein product [Durusdinium trenchii]|uniref:Uncharacterized protein n=1 Tax=Durusdinium trenchii TaxID=1381693 RepID=A0ABP0IFW8_9DINO
MSGLYTIFDCLTEGRPFAACLLHEVVHHWAQGAHELATFSPGKELERFGLSFLRVEGLEKSIAYGKHSRTAVHSHLDKVQASWLNDSDLSRMDKKGEATRRVFDQELQTLLDGGEVPDALQIWTFRVKEILRCLAPWAPQLSSSIDLTVVHLDQRTTELPVLPGVKVVSVENTKLAVRRFLQRRLRVSIGIHLELPSTLGTPVEWKMEAYQMESNPCKIIPCTGTPTVLLVPGQHEAATARVPSVSEFQFRRLVRIAGINLCCFYGVPLVLHPSEIENHADLSARRDGGDGFCTLMEHLVEGVGALYISKVCPMELCTRGGSPFTWLATVPLGSQEPFRTSSRDRCEKPQLVLRGLCDLHRGVVKRKAKDGVGPAGPVSAEFRGVEESWSKLSYYNPLSTVSNVHGLRVLEDVWLPTEAPHGSRGRGRPKGRGGEAPKLKEHLRPGKSLEEVKTDVPEVCDTLRPRNMGGATDRPSLAQLAPMLQQPPRRRLRLAGERTITEEEVQRLADGSFEFNF